MGVDDQKAFDKTYVDDSTTVLVSEYEDAVWGHWFENVFSFHHI